MRRVFFEAAAFFAVLFLSIPAEARGHRHSAYRHINSRGHVSYYHRHSGGGHHHHATIETPSDASVLADVPTPANSDLEERIVRSHKYLSRYRCGDHYCYNYPSKVIGTRDSEIVTDARPTPVVEVAPPSASGVALSARELGIATAVRVKACEEPVEALVQQFMTMLAYNSSTATLPLSQEAIRSFSDGIKTEISDVKSCPDSRDNYAKFLVRFLSIFYAQEGRPEIAYRVRLHAARYETMCQSAETSAEGDRILTEMRQRLGLKSAVLPTADDGIFDEYAKVGEDGCVAAARIANW